MDKINKKILILLVTVLSLISFTMGVKAEISGGTGNLDVGSGSNGGSSDPWNDLRMDRQILKLRVFSSSNTLKKTGYIALKGGADTISATVCSNNSDSDTTFFSGSKYTQFSQTTGNFKCTTKTISVSSIGEYSGDAWNYDGANAASIAKWIENNKYSNLKAMLNKIGYTSYANGDYVIIEPFVKITCEKVETFGTITGLLATNNAVSHSGADSVTDRCPNDNWWGSNLRQVLSRIAVAFRVNSSVTCLTGRTYDRILESSHNYFKLPFQGCGYNRYNISEIIDEGKLILNKVKSDGSTLIIGKSATFNLYKNYDCSGDAAKIITVGTSGTTSVSLAQGKYSIKEKTAPQGYNLSSECKNFDITNGNDKTVSYKNKPTCELAFNELSNKKNPTARIGLYKTYKKRNLLNFTITDAATACNNNSNGYPPDTSRGCLSYSDIYTKFNYSNASYFTTSQSVDGGMAYCIDNVNLTNIYAPPGVQKISFNTVKSGRMVINMNYNNRTIATAKIDKICYVYGAGYNQNTQNALKINGTQEDYLIEFNGVNLSRTSTTSNTYRVGKYEGTTYTEYTSSIEYKYNLSPVYCKIGTGESTNSTSGKLIGYGVISKFSDDGIKNINFKLLKGTSTKYESTNYCSYKAVPELIIPPGSPENPSDPGDPDTPWKLNLAFRQISKSNPFPGKDGTGRTVGKNWCYGSNCNNNNKTVEQAITNKNDSYNSTGDGPKYTINLNTKTIEQIKNKNKGQAYDDFGENCNTSSGTCAIDFINWMKSQGILKEG